MSLRLQQRLVLRLPVNLHQGSADLGKNRAGRQATVRVNTDSSGAADDPLDDDFVFGFEFALPSFSESSSGRESNSASTLASSSLFRITSVLPAWRGNQSEGVENDRVTGPDVHR